MGSKFLINYLCQKWWYLRFLFVTVNLYWVSAIPSTDVDYNFDMVGVIPRAHARYLAHPKLLFPVRVRTVNNGPK